jgi:hypothetical protein
MTRSIQRYKTGGDRADEPWTNHGDVKKHHQPELSTLAGHVFTSTARTAIRYPSAGATAKPWQQIQTNQPRFNMYFYLWCVDRQRAAIFQYG